MVVCYNPSLLYFASRFRNILSHMSPFEISSYLSTNILILGISSITPMMYLSLDTIKCLINADHTKNFRNQCSGVLVPQLSICFFILIIMFAKTALAPLSTTSLNANKLIKLNSPRRLIFEGTLFGLSFLLNFYLFTNMEEGRAADSIWCITATAMFLALTPVFLELLRMLFHNDHRTSVALPPRCSLTSPPLQRDLPLPAESLTLSSSEGGFV